MRNGIIFLLLVIMSMPVRSQNPWSRIINDSKLYVETSFSDEILDLSIQNYPNLGDFELVSNLEKQEDIFLSYTRPACCKKWSWAMKISVNGERYAGFKIFKNL